MLSPGYSYSRAPDQDHFLKREQTTRLFRRLLDGAKRGWRFNQSPLFLEFLKGNWQLDCTPWGSPAYNLFGWQRPCYLLDDGYAATFAELMETTDWHRYGHKSGNPRCRDCMVHCGYEPSAVTATFDSLRGFLATARLTLFGIGRSNSNRVELDDAVSVRRPAAPPLYNISVRGAGASATTSETACPVS
jgi:hypothetical protein